MSVSGMSKSIHRRTLAARNACLRSRLLVVAALSATLLAVTALLLLTATGESADREVSPVSGSLSRGSGSRLHVVFSTECSIYNDWQSVVLVDSHLRSGFPGRISRIVSCDDSFYELPRSNHERFRVFWAPDYDPWRKTGDSYAPRNRPHALLHLFKNEERFVEDDEIIVLVDPDQIILSDWTGFNVTEGNPIAAGYSSGTAFLNWAKEFCDGHCDNVPNADQLQIGAPYIVHVRDLKKIVPVWIEVMEAMRKKDPRLGGWLTDMYAYTVATLRLNIRHKLVKMMVSHPGDDREPWDLADDSPASPPLFILHYCQRIQIGTYNFNKHDFKSRDIKDCANPLRFPELADNDARVIKGADSVNSLMQMVGKLPKSMNDPRVRQENLDRETVKTFRNAWLYKNVIPVANQAFDNYRRDFCRPNTI